MGSITSIFKKNNPNDLFIFNPVKETPEDKCWFYCCSCCTYKCCKCDTVKPLNTLNNNKGKYIN